MNEETVDDLDIRRKRQCIHCGIWYPVEYVEAQPEVGWDIDLNRPYYACKMCLGRLAGLLPGQFVIFRHKYGPIALGKEEFLKMMTLNDSK